MVFRKPGNGRDDRSEKSSGRNSRGGEQRGKNPSRSGSSSSKFSGNKSGEFSPRTGKPFEGGEGKSDRPFGERKTGSGKSFGERSEGRGNKSFGEKKFGDRPSGEKRFGSKSFGDKKFGDRSFGEKKFGDKKFGERKSFDKNSGGKPFQKRSSGDRYENRGEQSAERPVRFENPARRFNPEFAQEQKPVRTLRAKKSTAAPKDDGLIRLNRYISNAGICSRRKADELIEAGVISVNGEVVSELGYKVDPFKDVIRYNGETLKREKNVYVLLNKPKDYITTTDDPQERRTVMHLVDKATKERIYPVGRLDRNTTGLLLMTNDGDLADKLSHPRNSITKLYQVELDKNLTQGDLNKIAFGLELEDGFIKPDMVSYVTGGSKREIGIQIHSGRNRIVRRIFEHLGYEVVKLDRSVYANLTKKDLPRGRWRYLEDKEIIQLKHLVK
ncbi:rRNA pseudouridine synthase [Mucilaginibacter sp. RS28]|uniref:Pseudouridine synthase n=1 Tax=Mucilaginibacter straminoryzae TaxID=2932774 RepID=A0A9X2BA56_9SPHI|nr:pseudouridine synthase [Mucilaginibacter straminoryzae]MCJ8211394.1 rRNA pseudouridine synthase [Mucilaginibacter straminoryzae]